MAGLMAEKMKKYTGAEFTSDLGSLGPQSWSKYNWRFSQDISPSFGMIINLNQTTREATITGPAALFDKLRPTAQTLALQSQSAQSSSLSAQSTQSMATVPLGVLYAGQSVSAGTYTVKLADLTIPYGSTSSQAILQIYDSNNKLVSENAIEARTSKEIILSNGDKFTAVVGATAPGLTTAKWAEIGIKNVTPSPQTTPIGNIVYAGQSISAGGEYSVRLADLTIPYGTASTTAIIQILDSKGTVMQDGAVQSGLPGGVVFKVNNGLITVHVTQTSPGLTTAKWAKMDANFQAVSSPPQLAESSVLSSSDIKTYMANLTTKELGAGITIHREKVSMELLGILRKQYEDVTGGSKPLNSVSNKAGIRVNLGYNSKPFAAKISADNERQEADFRGSWNKTQMSLNYTRSDIKGDWTEWIDNKTEAEISQELLANKKAGVRLGIVYTGYNNTVWIADAKDKQIRDLVGLKAHVVIKPSDAVKVVGTLGGSVYSNRLQGLSIGTSVDYKNLNFSFAREEASATKETAFKVGFKF